MRYIWTLIWAILLSNMAYYILSAMQGGAYNFVTASLFGIVFTIAIAILGEGLTKHPDEA